MALCGSVVGEGRMVQKQRCHGDQPSSNTVCTA
jgi:hypothetical protein